MIADHPLRAVARVNRGPLEQHRNGTTAHRFATVILTCGHEIGYPRLKNPSRRPPLRVRCDRCEA